MRFTAEHATVAAVLFALVAYSTTLKLLVSHTGSATPSYRTPGAVGELVDSDGAPVDLSEIASKRGLVVVHFWASWCVPCLVEWPSLRDAAVDLGDDNLAFLAVTAEDPVQLQRFLERYPQQIRVALDSGGELHHSFNVELLPTTLLLNSDLQVVERVNGAFTNPRGELEAWLRLHSKSKA